MPRMTELELKIANLELAEELRKEAQRLQRAYELDEDVSLVDVMVARRRADIAREKWNEPTSKD